MQYAINNQKRILFYTRSLVRNSLNYVSWKDKKAVAQGLKRIYQSATLEEAKSELSDFAAQWDVQYRSISQMWRNH